MAEGREIKDMLERMTMDLANFLVRLNQIKDQHEKYFAELKKSLKVVKRRDKGKNVEGNEGNGDIYSLFGQSMAWVFASHRTNTYYGYTWWISIWNGIFTPVSNTSRRAYASKPTLLCG
uniref:Uncharacterized protein n=1 Tax=Solanum tuberosum TaxID=4113 RepID=M1DWW4_SOLTU